MVGDRQDDLIERLGEIGARDTDVVAIGHKQRYLRGRDRRGDRRAAPGRRGAGGRDRHPAYDTEVACLSALVGQALPGDVVGLMCHAEREEVYDWIARHGGTADAPRTLAAKVRRAAG